MISCRSCNRQNPDESTACINCGKELLQFNILCGVPVIDGGSRGQVLAMRYVIEQQLSEDAAGCTYTAEDVLDNSSVIIRALPLSIFLGPKQIQQLKDSLKTIDAPSAVNALKLKAFEISGTVRFFVYDCTEYDNNILAEQARKDASYRLSLQTTDTLKTQKDKTTVSIETEIQIKKLKEEKEHALKLSRKHEEELTQLRYNFQKQKDEYSSLLDQAENKLQTKQQAYTEAEQKCRDYINRISKLELKTAGSKEKFAAELSELKQKLNKQINAARSAETENSAHKETIEKLKAQISKEQQHHSAALNDTNLKIAALTNEKEKALKLSRKFEAELEQVKATLQELKQEFKLKPAEAKEKLQTEIQGQKPVEEKCLFLEQNIENHNSKTNTDRLADKDCNSFNQTISKLNEQLIAQQQKHAADLNKLNWKTDALSANLMDADKKIQSLSQENKKLLKQNNSNDNFLQQKHVEEFKKAQWKIRVLSAELEKLIKLSETEKKAEIKPASPSRFKYYKAILPLSLISGALCGTGLTYLHMNSLKQNNNRFKQQVTVSANVNNDKQSAIDSRVLITESLSQKESGDRKNTAENLEKTTEFPKTVQTDNGNALFESGLAYYLGKDVRQDQRKAFELFKRSAHAGNLTAMYNIGMMYHEGSGIDRDVLKAVEWYERAASHGLPKAMNHLAQMYYYGQTVEQNHKKAAEYYELSAKAGDVKAMYNLALLYQNGNGVDKDVVISMKWLIQAARQGDPESMYQLGIMFEGNNSIKKDNEKSVYWFKSAAKAGHGAAKTKLEQSVSYK